MAATTGPGSSADRTAQNDSEGFVSRYNKFAALSLKRQRELLPIFRHRKLSYSKHKTDGRDFPTIPRGELSGDYSLWTNGMWKVDSYAPQDSVLI